MNITSPAYIKLRLSQYFTAKAKYEGNEPLLITIDSFVIKHHLSSLMGLSVDLELEHTINSEKCPLVGYGGAARKAAYLLRQNKNDLLVEWQICLYVVLAVGLPDVHPINNIFSCTHSYILSQLVAWQKNIVIMETTNNLKCQAKDDVYFKNKYF